MQTRHGDPCQCPFFQLNNTSSHTPVGRCCDLCSVPTSAAVGAVILSGWLECRAACYTLQVMVRLAGYETHYATTAMLSQYTFFTHAEAPSAPCAFLSELAQDRPTMVSLLAPTCQECSWRVPDACLLRTMGPLTSSSRWGSCEGWGRTRHGQLSVRQAAYGSKAYGTDSPMSPPWGRCYLVH